MSCSRTDVAALSAELVRAALAGVDGAELVRRVATAAGCTCRLVTPHGRLLAASDDGPGLALAQARAAARDATVVTAADGWVATVLALRADVEIRRLLLVDRDADARAHELAAAAGPALLIDDLRDTAGPVAAPNPLRPADVVAALRRGDVGEDVVAAASQCGVLAPPRRGPAATMQGTSMQGTSMQGAALHYGGHRHRAWATALTWLEHAVEVQGDTAWTVVRGRDELETLRRTIARTVDGDVVAASGSPVTSLAALAGSFDEAGRLLALARADGRATYCYEDAGVRQILLTTPRSRLEDYVTGALGPVLDKPVLLHTLRAWLATGGSRRIVSEQLHLHRNSVGYRVRRVKDLLGVDPLAPAAAAQLHLALAAWDLLEAQEPSVAVRTGG